MISKRNLLLLVFCAASLGGSFDSCEAIRRGMIVPQQPVPANTTPAEATTETPTVRDTEEPARILVQQADIETVTRYLKMSADQGSLCAQFGYALCLENGTCVEKDLFQAARYYGMSANQGSSCAQYRYAICLENGSGIEKNLFEAARYYGMAAEQGNPEAEQAYAEIIRRLQTVDD